MNESEIPNLAIGAFALAAAILYAAWDAYATQNPRDAKMLFAIGSVSLVGGAAGWL